MKNKSNDELLKLERLLKKKEFRIVEYTLTEEEKNSIDVLLINRANRLLGRSFHDSFNISICKYKRIPTPTEFMLSQFKDLKKNFASEKFRKNRNIYFKLTSAVEREIKNRILRAYKSMVIELHTVLQLNILYPSLKVKRNTELDFLGVDIQLYDKRYKSFYNIHITSNTDKGLDNLIKKEGRRLTFKYDNKNVFARPTWGLNNKKAYVGRDFTNHLIFRYDTPKLNDNSFRGVNGYQLFTEEYISRKINFKRNRIKVQHNESRA